MAAACENCGRGLSVLQRARGHHLCDDCQTAATAAAKQAEQEYPQALQNIINAGVENVVPASQLRVLEQTIRAGGGDVTARKAERYRAYLNQSLADEVLTPAEERVLDAVGSALFGDDEEEAQKAILRDYRAKLFIAMVNDGRLPERTDGPIVLKRGETLHLVESAALLKEVIQREFRGGSRGVSFRIMKGVSYRVGAYRGHMVEVGRTLEPIDDGDLCITSSRAVFTGMRKTIEMPYTKLIDLNVFTDAIQIHLSNRQNPPTFRVSSGPMVAAAINTAMQRTLP